MFVRFLVGAMFASSVSSLTNRFDAFFSQTIGAFILILLPFCLYWGYFAFFEILWQGKTPGKRIAGIRVIHQSGRPMTAIECIGRNLMRGLDILPGMYGVGLICMMCNEQNRRVGDYLAGTIVVHDKALESVAPSWGEKTANQAVTPELRRLTPDELVLIETYLNRRYELDSDVRSTAAQGVVAIVTQKTAMQKSPEQRDDDFPENVARQLRDAATF